MPTVSCLMPTFNRAAFIPNAIGYFLRQDMQDAELVIMFGTAGRGTPAAAIPRINAAVAANVGDPARQCAAIVHILREDLIDDVGGDTSRGRAAIGRPCVG